MLVSIIIPVYNRATIVQRTLDSVLKQTHRPLQLILVDNMSTDDTLEVLNDFKQKNENEGLEIIVTQEQHHTAGAARNKGFSLATADYVMFFDSDDEMMPTLVERYVEKIGNAHEKPDVVFTPAILYGREGGSRQLPFFTSDIMANEILHSLFATQRYIVRREFFAETGLWPVDLKCWNDWEMGIRLLLHHPRLEFLNEPLVHINDSGEASITGTSFSARHGRWEESLDLVQKHFEDSNEENVQRYIRLVDYRRVVLAANYEAEGHPELAKPLYELAYSRLKKNTLLHWMIPVLYRRIRNRKRGSARIARLIIK